MRALGYWLFFLATVGALVWFAAKRPGRDAAPPVAPARVSRSAGEPDDATAPGCGQPCGIERWSVKTMSDAMSGQVDLNPRHARIEELTRVERPKSYPENERLAPEELQVYRVEGDIVEWSLQRDSDFHIVLTSPSSESSSMVVEIPDADCAGACASGFGDAYLRARRTLLARLCPDGCPQRNPLDVPVRVIVTGVGFIDRPHNATGAAPNYFELHPVLSLEFVP